MQAADVGGASLGTYDPRMATQGERRALVFLAAVAVLGAATRAWRSRHASADPADVTRQLAAVDRVAARRRSTTKAESTATPAIVDLDIASAKEIERLPGIGPALAKRIVKDRESNGPFRCLAALDRVKGVGPAMLARLDSMVTFSAAGGVPCESPEPPRATGRRR